MPAPSAKNTILRFPDNTVVTASAGSGKTYALTWRYLQLLLSNKNPHRLLRNLLAITFTNNAAKEMRGRVLTYLKQLCLGNRDMLSKAAEFLEGDPLEIQSQSGALLERIFEDYSDFQVRTIDSFMSTVFKASALEFGFHPDYDILMTNDVLIDEAFDVFARDLRSVDARLLDYLVDRITQSKSAGASYVWDPFTAIKREVKSIYQMLAWQTEDELLRDLSREVEDVTRGIVAQAGALQLMLRQSGLRSKHHVQVDLELIQSGRVNELLDRAPRTEAVNKPKGREEEEAYQRWGENIASQLAALNDLMEQYTILNSRSFYQPYLQAMALVRSTLNRIKRQRGQIFIDDVNKMLVGRLNEESVPDVYFKLGDTIYHYLIDEFQDTSPIQWANLKPLIENSLSVGGSLFVVGDMKQSIYGFRGADWMIMKRMKDRNEFPSAGHHVHVLGTNWRSGERVVDFAKEVFEEVVPGTEYADAARESGLTHVYQNVKEENKGKGYVEVCLFPKEELAIKEKEKVVEIIKECQRRGYQYRDIAILTPTNKKVIEVSGWLNKEKIGFLSYSSLDVRTRKVAGEIIALLQFLDSPVDDLSFATFVIGDLFTRLLAADAHAAADMEPRDLVSHSLGDTFRPEPLYKTFQREHPSLWNTYFEHLYTQVGYLPLYDLLAEVYATFKVFDVFPHEEAALVKLMEVVMAFEREGTNDIKEFLAFAADDSEQSAWNIDAPTDKDAVTLMTVHKAKGLERPVVIVLLYEKSTERRGYFIEHTSDGIGLLRITKAMAARVGGLQTLYDEQKLKDRVDDLNQLYVALTRAKEELYVVGVHGEKQKEPILFLPAAGYEPKEKPPVMIREPKGENPLTCFHHSARRAKEAVAYDALAYLERKRGDLIHKVLSSLEYVGPTLEDRLDVIMESMKSEMGEDLPMGRLKQVIIDFLLTSGAAEYFADKPGRRILREQELCTRDGAVFRADRVVMDGDVATVIDFKTGGDEKEEEYRRQIKNYMDIISETTNAQRVVGVLAYVDRKIVRVVG